MLLLVSHVLSFFSLKVVINNTLILNDGPGLKPLDNSYGWAAQDLKNKQKSRGTEKLHSVRTVLNFCVRLVRTVLRTHPSELLSG